MKQLHEVVAKRKELRVELEYYESQKVDMLRGRKFRDLDEDEKKEFSFLLNVAMKLKVQIDALTYVINYDSELEDVTARPVWRVNNGRD